MQFIDLALQQLGRGNCLWEGGGDHVAVVHEFRASGDLSELAPEYPWAEVCGATGGFCPGRRLGAGASGTVFGGCLREGTEAAIKILDRPVGTGFEDEVRLLSRCRHPNVVLLLGFAREEAAEPPEAGGRGPKSARGGRRGQQRCALIYELLRGGDLYRRLQCTLPPFSWHERLRAAVDVSRGLAHLHKHRPEIFHRDIKSQNILFGADGTAKIGDFGLACMPGCKSLPACNDVAGTVGYVDPQYLQTGLVTEASEVYSWGMVLIELLTGRPPAVLGADGQSCIFLSDELRLWDDRAKHRVLHQLDVHAQWPLPVAAGLVTLALLCVHMDADRRPGFLEATSILQTLSPAALEAACEAIPSHSTVLRARTDSCNIQGICPAKAGVGLAQDASAGLARQPASPCQAGVVRDVQARVLHGGGMERCAHAPVHCTRGALMRSKSLPAGGTAWPAAIGTENIAVIG